MKQNLLKCMTVAAVMGASTLSAMAQNAPFFPKNQRANELTNPTTADVANFEALSGDYTIEMNGTAGTTITIPHTKYTSLSYTPVSTGVVRLVASNGTIYAYEKAAGEFEYKGTVTDFSKVTYPEMGDETVNAETNLLSDPDFNNTEGGLIDKYTDRYKLGGGWSISDESIYGNIRVGNNNNTHESATAKPNVFVWRSDEARHKDKYFYQEVKNITENSKYKFVVKVAQNTNGNGIFDIRLGTTPGGDDQSSTSITVINNTAKILHSGELSTSSLETPCYFSLYNKENCQTGSNKNQSCCQIDYIILSEAIKVETKVAGASDVKYINEAIAPELKFAEGEGYDFTNLITNATVTSEANWANGRKGENQQYTDAPDKTYLDNYNETRDMYQTITLPAGVYKLTAATRADANCPVGNIYVRVKVDETTNRQYSTNINKAGNQGNVLGNGWDWTTVNDIVVSEEGTEVTIGFYSECPNGTWAGADNFKLSFVRDYTDETAELSIAINSLNEQIEATTTARQNFPGVGTGTFQINSNGEYFLALDNEIEKATSATTADEATLNTVQTASNEMKEALDNLRRNLANLELNAPKEGEVFNIVCAANVNWKNKVLTFKDGNAKAGTYGMGYTEDAKSVYNQTVTFTPAEGTNCYKLSITDAEGNTHYVCVGANYGGDNQQLRATTEPSKALAIKIAATNTEGIYNMYNTVTNTLIGNNDNGFFTRNMNADVRIVPAEKLNVTLNITDAGWATIILPFDADKQDGIEAIYSYESTTGTTINLKAEDSFKANTPYLVKGAARTYDFEGYGAAKTASYTAGRFVGALVANTVNAPKGSYILQKQDEGLGFYLVDTEEGAMMNQYRVYLTAEENSDTSNEVKAFFFGTDDATAINGLTNAEGVKETARYNAAGVKVNAPVKGINIVKMSDGSVKKVIVK